MTPRRPDDNRLLYGFFGGLGALLVVSVLFSWKMGYLKEGMSWDERGQAMRAVQAELSQNVARLKSLAGSDCTYDGECKLLGIGVQACGGYSDYLVYSAASADTGTVSELVTKINSITEKLHALALDAPKCGKPPIQPKCKKGKCVVQEDSR